ncbi:hypothetical protein FIBSPDRAFT_917685 [Athelia psychrophila]|uniref:Uncharacterized protein n=1 Tax=Athelia psychrophila TaxID=1759441 RepID=A0A166RPT7_9AGAM|nr:hypothetical protein FIBSPDRAFT_917685 [Fibularhizoctonia sp. CBS 109695]
MRNQRIDLIGTLKRWSSYRILQAKSEQEQSTSATVSSVQVTLARDARLDLAPQATQDITNSTDPDGSVYSEDPVLKYRPYFARSLPVQILVTGIVLTLVGVLFIHLIFTAQYHWTLAQVNYILQLSGVSTLFISLVATLHVVLSQSVEESLQWPYMLSYIAVDTPPLDNVDLKWTDLEQATWLVMDATTAGLIQITHIHFLTLLYPSRIEARLIYMLLGPLALSSAICQLCPIRAIGATRALENTDLIYTTDAIRNICNATLSFLFTSSLFIWGFFVNFKQAWRTDGGTAAFGVGALTLAVVSTVLNMIYIPTEDQYAWLPSLMWAVVLWQSFLGWWWWVGAGLGVGEVDELLRREQKKEIRQKTRKERREAQRQKARMVWKGVTGAFTHRPKDDDKDKDSDEESVVDESDEQVVEGHSTAVQSSYARRDLSDSTTTTEGSSSSSVSSTGNASLYTRLKHTRVGRYMDKWFGNLRIAHLTAARDQAVDRVERMQHTYPRDGGRRDGSGGRHSRIAFRGNDGSEREEEDDERTLADLPMGDAMDDARSPRRVEAAMAEERLQANSFWWWGPLRRWRLQDATAY